MEYVLEDTIDINDEIPTGTVLVAGDQTVIKCIFLSETRDKAIELLAEEFPKDELKFIPTAATVNMMGHSEQKFNQLEVYLARILAYLSGENNDIRKMPLYIEGTDYQKRVWKRIQKIPYGKTITYGELAEELSGSKDSSIAVGGACAANRHAIAIPCHRVVPANTDPSNNFTNYRWGANWKKYLLNLEKSF